MEGGGCKNAAEMTAALIKISFGVFHAVECGNLSSAADRSDGSVTERRERVDTDGRAAPRRYSPTRSNILARHLMFNLEVDTG